MELFDLKVEPSNLHPGFKRLLDPNLAAERAVLSAWARGFHDRDRKFVKEFQTTYESSLWELYLHAVLRDLGQVMDFAHHAPDFLVTNPSSFTMEATIAAPPLGGAPAIGTGVPEIPADLNEFNRQATLRACNAISSKLKRYREHYSTLDHVKDRPFVLALTPFDRPLAYLEYDRPIQAALYGRHIDEERTMAEGMSTVLEREIAAVSKRPGVDVPVGLFCSDVCKEISAVVYSAVAGWGKVRALADSPGQLSLYTTLHASTRSSMPEVRRARKRNYSEHLLDGLHVLHNPFAKHPLPADVFKHPSVSQDRIERDGSLHRTREEGFLMTRQIFSILPV
ncbi:hypothetical protein J7J08_05920 [Stenotrophomonas sp. ISL-67]|uniref:hypothetical protein n=1 Tax=Stenotrophomonas sp. ISL-67 TaxID=2819171 RepID=UPI001BE51C2C|nr:hypothetical protein [Stenotrophomonas sp. ISL-67]MBT2767167.1 hypothetical protein [Stenotrophomonas sp. ISL-67]